MLLDRSFPDVEKVCGGMNVNLVTKDVTYETLKDPKFLAWIKEQFPANADLRKPIEEFDAARQRETSIKQYSI